MMSRPVASSLLVLLTVHLSGCLGAYQVYIDSTHLEEYFTGTPHLDSVQDRKALIISGTQSEVRDNGSLILFSTVDGESSGLYLPTLPREVNQVSVTWMANDTQVEYSLSVSVDPTGFFASSLTSIPSISSEGEVPTQSNVFTLDVTCGVESLGEGDLSVSLNITDNSTTTQADFTITKDCGEIQPSSSPLPTVLPTTAATASLSASTSPSTHTFEPSSTAHVISSSVSLHSSTVVSSSPTVPVQTSTAAVGTSAATTTTLAQTTTPFVQPSSTQSRPSSVLHSTVQTSGITSIASSSPSTMVLTPSLTTAIASSTLIQSTSSVELISVQSSVISSSIKPTSTLAPRVSSQSTLNSPTETTLVPSLSSSVTPVLSSTPMILSSTPIVLSSTPIASSSTPVISSATPVVSTSTPIVTSVLSSTPIPSSVSSSTPVVLSSPAVSSTPVVIPSSAMVSNTTGVVPSSTAIIPSSTVTSSSTVMSSTILSSTAVLSSSPVVLNSTTVLRSTPAVSRSTPILSSSKAIVTPALSSTYVPLVPSSAPLSTSQTVETSSVLVFTTMQSQVPTSSPSPSATPGLSPTSRVSSSTMLLSSAMSIPVITSVQISTPVVLTSTPLFSSAIPTTSTPVMTSVESSTPMVSTSTSSALLPVSTPVIQSSTLVSRTSSVVLSSTPDVSTPVSTALNLLTTSLPSSPNISDTVSSTQPSISVSTSAPVSRTVLLTASPGLVNATGVPTREPELVMILLIAFAPVVAVLFVCIIIICCCIACICCKKRRTKKHFIDDTAELPVAIYSPTAPEVGDIDDSLKKPEAPLSLWMNLQWGVVSTLPEGIQGVIKAHSVDRRSLSLLSTINRGEFGCIVNGQLSLDRTDLVDGHKGVMMKMLIGFTQTNGHYNEIAKFLEHATLLRGLDHPNVATVLRISVEDNLVPLVLYPIVEYGNLHTFLTFCRVSPDESPLNPVTLQYKVNFGLQIAYAMNFLSDKGVVHPDLALRNCLLDTNYLVKVGDNALSQEFFPKCYHTIRGAVRPVRWAALETLVEGLCTSKSNVWSYAVTLWEIMTKAEFPYNEVDNNRSIPSHVMMGARLEQPVDCPDYLYQIMQACWDSNAENRPNFTYLHRHMEEFNQQLATVEDESPPSVPVMRVGSYSRENSQLSLDHPSSHQSRRRRSGRNSFSKSSPAVTRRSINSRVSATGSEHLSLTFSVLSGDLSGGSSSENEEGPEALSPLAESVVYQMLPSLLKDDKEDEMEGGSDDVKNLPTSSPMNLVTSFLDSSRENKHPNGLDNSAKYTPLSSNFISPAPLTPSTITTRLTPSETISYSSSSQFGPSTIRSDESTSTPHPTSSPSPDLTSKSSMFGEEMSSNPRYSYISNSNADTASKASDSASITTPGLDGYPHSQGATMYAQSNGHTEVPIEHSSTNGTGNNTYSPERTDAIEDSTVVSGMNGYSTKSNADNPPAKSQGDANGTSFNLGLTDLSTDLMATFDSWNI